MQMKLTRSVSQNDETDHAIYSVVWKHVNCCTVGDPPRN